MIVWHCVLKGNLPAFQNNVFNETETAMVDPPPIPAAKLAPIFSRFYNILSWLAAAAYTNQSTPWQIGPNLPVNQ